MASIVERGGRWRALVRKSGIYRCATFGTESAARTWANTVEAVASDPLTPTVSAADLAAAVALDEEYGLISVGAFAAFTGRTVNSLANDRRKHRGPAYVKFGRTVKYFRESVKHYAIESTVIPTPTLLDGCPRRLPTERQRKFRFWASRVRR